MLKLTEDTSFENFTLIIPSVAVGNIGQLCVDLLISSLNLRKIGSVFSESFVPIVGLDPYDFESKSLCSAIDVYVEPEKKFVLLQIRSTYVGGTSEFFAQIATFAEERKIKQTIILTSSYGYEKAGVRTDPATLHYLATERLLSTNQKSFDDLGWKKYEKNALDNSREVPRIPGGGFANGLYKFFVDLDIPCLMVFRYCFEGDNIPDALDFTARFNQWLKLLSTNPDGSLKVKLPSSWEYLFGNPPPMEIY